MSRVSIEIQGIAICNNRLIREKMFIHSHERINIYL